MQRRTFSSYGLVSVALALAACANLSLPIPSLKPSPPAEIEHPFYSLGEPYKIDGITYTPAEDWSYDETGVASWYGEEFEGKYTANGEIYDLNALTAAHRTLPLPSIVLVTELTNGRSIRVRLNDRGPFDGGRIIDLSRRAAQLLGFEEQGTAKVRVQLLFKESLEAAKLAGRKGPDPQDPATAEKPAPEPVEQPVPSEPARISREELPALGETIATVEGTGR